MATYDQWNRAIADYFTRDRTPGSSIYLHASKENLESIAADLGIPAEAAERDFLASVQRKCIRISDAGADEIDSPFLDAWSSEISRADRLPNAIAFLALTVFAASRMGERDDLDATAYFPIIRELLGDLPATHNQAPRPVGWVMGEEARWWHYWRVWLGRRQLVATFQFGSSNRWKYVQLPLSQTLLRPTDEEKLLRTFDQHSEFKDDFTDRHLMRLVHKYTEVLTSQLQRILKDPSRFAEITGAISDLHADWRSGDRVAGVSERRTMAIPIGIVRTVDNFEETSYVLQAGIGRKQDFPSLDQHVLSEGLMITSGGRRYRMPRRDMWIFAVTDDAVESVMTSVDQPPAGVRLAILAHRKVVPYLQKLQRLRLLHWRGDWDLVTNEPYKGWVEIEDCSVAPGDWPQDEVADALRPRDRVRISFTRGMSVGARYVWLDSVLPEVTVQVSDARSNLTVTVSEITDNGVNSIRSIATTTGTATPLGPLSPGLYRLECEVNGDHAVRDFQIKNPLLLGLGERLSDISLSIDSHTVFGARINRLSHNLSL